MIEFKEQMPNIRDLIYTMNICGYTINNILRKVLYELKMINSQGCWGGYEYIQLVEELNNLYEIAIENLDIITCKIPERLSRLFNFGITIHNNVKIDKIEIIPHQTSIYSYNQYKIKIIMGTLKCYFKEINNIFLKYEKCINQVLCNDKMDVKIKEIWIPTKKNMYNAIKDIKVTIITQSIMAANSNMRRDTFKKSIAMIIPAYNANKTLGRTLYSIATQKLCRDMALNVYIVNDASDYNYENIIYPFKKYFNIQELKVEKNMGPGYARQYGIDNSVEDYIVFMDSDDYFFSPKSLTCLYEAIDKNRADLVISKFVSELNGRNEIKDCNYTWLHGKIFSRKFLEENKIKFNNTRENEDSGFNFLIKFHKPKTIFLDEITYIWSKNQESMTRKNNGYYDYYGLKGFSYNIAWAGNLAIERNLDIQDVTIITLRAILSMWTAYSQYYNTYDVDKILSWTKILKEIYDRNKNLYINNNILDFEIKNKRKINEEEHREMVCVIDFDEFLRRVDKAEDCTYNI